MIESINFIKVIAMVLITNSHYSNVYPYSSLAMGGLLGDVLFFMATGFLCTNIREGFIKWYFKKILRIYPAVIIATVIFSFLGYYDIKWDNIESIIKWVIYPTYYHFIASIMVLFIPYYFIVKFEVLKNGIFYVIAVVIFSWITTYCLFYDYSYYHIDNVREGFIRFLFGIAMLLGVFVRNNIKKVAFRRKYIILFLCTVFYFFSKIAFSHFTFLSTWQILNQILLLMLGYVIFIIVLEKENYIKSLNIRITNIMRNFSQITLEVYVVQYYLIYLLSNIAIFPINLIIVSLSIGLAAYIMHLVIKNII